MGIDRESLITHLTTAVQEAHAQNPKVLGVILFGSRTHEEQARDDSDVDLVPVQSETGDEPQSTLRLEIQTCLQSIGLVPDFCVPIVLESIRKRPLEQLHDPGWFLDKNSVYILTDPATETLLREWSGSAKKTLEQRYHHTFLCVVNMLSEEGIC